MKDISPLTGRPARLYCRKPQAEYYIADGLIYQKTPPAVEQMAAYAEREYSTGVYKDYIAAAPLKTATFRRRIKRLKKLGTKGRLLDVGCGCGFFIQVALEEGFDAYGIDFSHAARAAAAEEIQPRITIGDVNSLRRRGEEPFDVVVAFDIIGSVTSSPSRHRFALLEVGRVGSVIIRSFFWIRPKFRRRVGTQTSVSVRGWCAHFSGSEKIDGYLAAVLIECWNIPALMGQSQYTLPGLQQV